MNTRRGMGKGLGTGYKNLVPIDGHIHSLSAKGVKSIRPLEVYNDLMKYKSFRNSTPRTREEKVKRAIWRRSKNLSLDAQSFNLDVRYDTRKSFYGKARVETDEEGNKVLYSYNTKVAEILDGKPIVYGLYSQTTSRHIKEFLKQNGFKAEDSKQISKDYKLFAKSTMSIQEAKEILGDRATWELKNMKKALSSMQILNTPEENKRLEAVTVMLKNKSK